MLVAGPPGATSSPACWARMLGYSASLSNASRWVLTKWNFLLPRTFASTLVQPRVTAISFAARDFDDQQVGEVAALGVGDDDAGAEPGEDHVAHRQAAVDLGVGQHAGAAGAVAGDPVGVGGRLEVELVLDDDRPVERLAFVQLGEQQLEEVVLDRGRFRLAGEDRAERGRSGPPERDLLQADEVRLLAEDLLRQALGADREVGRFDLADDAAVGFDEVGRRGRLDRRRQVGAEVEVAGHHVDGRCPSASACRASPRRGRRRPGRQGRRPAATGPACGSVRFGASTLDSSSFPAPCRAVVNVVALPWARRAQARRPTPYITQPTIGQIGSVPSGKISPRRRCGRRIRRLPWSALR